MIVTHTVNATGDRRVYLGGKSSVECWIEPDAAGIGWTFRVDVSPTAFPLTHEQMRSWAGHTLLALAEALGVPPLALKAVPFERIAALHSANPAEFRRVALPKRQAVEQGFMATRPNITRPQANFNYADSTQSTRRRS